MMVMADAFDPAFGEAWNAGQCLGILGLPGVWMLLARHEGAAAGFALARIVSTRRSCCCSACGRRSGGTASARRCSIGSRRMRAPRGGARLHLEVRDGNPALLLYRARGFAQIGCRPGYYRGADGQSFDALSLAIVT